MNSYSIGVIGLGVMGRNLALNIERNGYPAAGFDLDEKQRATAAERFVGKKMTVCPTLSGFLSLLESPKKILMMVPAGKPVDAVIQELIPHLAPGDILIDGGNTYFPDTERRTRELTARGLHYIGTGVSGGEEGALWGPSIMPGGSPAAWPHVKDIFQQIAARVDDGTPCCDWVGENGAGHYVKMVHNGIEYGDMQLICEAYHLMKAGLGLGADELHRVFAEWYQGELNSYLIEITRDIFGVKDADGQPLVDKILDTAGQKGTGKWTVISSQDLGIPITLIAEAVYARCISALKDDRVAAARKLKGPRPAIKGDAKRLVEDIRRALYASKIISYAQGYLLMRAAAREYNWNLNYGGIALMWRGGCIIRSVFLGKIKEAFDRKPDLTNLLLDPFFRQAIKDCQRSWRKVVSLAARKGIPVPAFSTALAFYDSYRSAWLPANLLQAQRDYFGAHTYERVDQPRGQFFHTNWTGRGGTTASSTYTV